MQQRSEWNHCMCPNNWEPSKNLKTKLARKLRTSADDTVENAARVQVGAGCFYDLSHQRIAMALGTCDTLRHRCICERIIHENLCKCVLEHKLYHLQKHTFISVSYN